MGYLGMRVLTQFLAGHHPGPDAAIGKLYWSEYHKVITELASTSWVPTACTATGRKPSVVVRSRRWRRSEHRPSWVDTFLNARAGTIYAGSQPDPAQHHRRDDPRAAEGAQAGVISAAAAVAFRPRRCGSTAVRQMRRTTAPGWWKRRPFLPVPSGSYLRVPPHHAVRGSRSCVGSRRCGELPAMVQILGSPKLTAH